MFSPICSSSFHFLLFLILKESNRSLFFSSMCHAFDISKKSLPSPTSQRFSSVFFQKLQLFQAMMTRFEFIFLHGMRQGLKLTSFAYGQPSVPPAFVEKTTISPSPHCFPLLSKISCVHTGVDLFSLGSEVPLMSVLMFTPLV